MTKLLTIVCAECVRGGDTHPPRLGAFELDEDGAIRPKPFPMGSQRVVLEPIDRPDGGKTYPFICKRGHSRPCKLENVIGTFFTFKPDEWRRVVQW